MATRITETESIDRETPHGAYYGSGRHFRLRECPSCGADLQGAAGECVDTSDHIASHDPEDFGSALEDLAPTTASGGGEA